MEKIYKEFTIGSSFLMLLLILGTMLFGGIAVYFFPLGEGIKTFFSYTVGMILATVASIRMIQYYQEWQGFKFDSTHLGLLPILLPLPLFMQFGFTSHLAELIPMNDFFRKIFEDLMNDKSILTFITVAIAAPILEELIFRGIILEGLSKKYSAKTSILISSLLFGIIHLNPWQFIGAFCIGLIAGWVYLNTKNLLLPILIHFSNNFFFSLVGYFANEDVLIDEPMIHLFGNSTNQIIGVSLSVVLFCLSLYYLQRYFKRKTQSI